MELSNFWALDLGQNSHVALALLVRKEHKQKLLDISKEMQDGWVLGVVELRCNLRSEE